MARANCQLSPDDARVSPLFSETTANNSARFPPFLEPLRGGVTGKLALLQAAAAAAPWGLRSLRSASAYFKDERIRSASASSKYLGMRLHLPQLFSISRSRVRAGVFHRRVLRRVNKTIGRIAEEFGVRVLLNEPVEGDDLWPAEMYRVRTPNAS